MTSSQRRRNTKQIRRNHSLCQPLRSTRKQRTTHSVFCHEPWEGSNDPRTSVALHLQPPNRLDKRELTRETRDLNHHGKTTDSIDTYPPCLTAHCQPRKATLHHSHHTPGSRDLHTPHHPMHRHLYSPYRANPKNYNRPTNVRKGIRSSQGQY
jgi:hypothetical protein